MLGILGYIVIGVLVVQIGGISWWCFTMSYQDRNFRKYVKSGDPLYFYLGEIRHRGTLVRITDNTCIVLDRIGDSYTVPFSSIYPRFSYKYKK